MASTAVGLSSEQVASALQAACRAPSLHNTQPWKFQLGNGSITVFLDTTRVLPATDPGGREARISCGAAVFNIQAVLAEMGFTARTHINSRSGDTLLATVEVTGRRTPLERDHELSQAIWRRATNRRPFSDTLLPLDILYNLQSVATAEGAVLSIVGAPSLRNKIRELSNRALQTQQADPLWLAEWNAWTARENTKDGVPHAASGLPLADYDLWARRDFGTAHRPTRIPGKEYEHEPVIAVLSTWDDHPATQVQAGIALQRVLLTATTHGIAASFISQTIEVPTARATLRSLMRNHTEPQAMLRFGYGMPVAPTPRRPFSECLQDSAEASTNQNLNKEQTCISETQ